MTKCFLCGAQAMYCIKGQPEIAYCEECAVEAFGDASLLVKLEDENRPQVTEESDS